jgi:hypothetical protein
MHPGGFSGSTAAVELQSAAEIVPQEAEIFLATIPTGVAFAANQNTIENRSGISSRDSFYRSLLL